MSKEMQRLVNLFNRAALKLYDRYEDYYMSWLEVGSIRKAILKESRGGN